MRAKKAKKLKKHEKEVRRKAYLNLLLTLIAGFGIGIVLWNPLGSILNIFLGEASTVAIVLSLLGLGTIIYMMPLLHYREYYKTRADKKPDYYLDRNLNETPAIELLEEEGWEEIKRTEDRVVLETYPSLIHKLIGKKTTFEAEILERDGNQEIWSIKKDGEEFAKGKSSIESEGEGSLIEETGVSVKRFSPARLEIVLLIFPQLKRELEKAADQKLEIIDLNLEFGFSKFNLKSE